MRNFDQEQSVFRDSVFLPPTSPLPTTADCVTAAGTTTISFVPDEVHSISAIPAITVKSKNVHRNEKNLPPHCQKKFCCIFP